jgi:hypothetical protein
VVAGSIVCKTEAFKLTEIVVWGHSAEIAQKQPLFPNRDFFKFYEKPEK